VSESTRTLRVAAVQMASENGQIDANLARALPLVEQAAAQGAQLIVLPEFMPTGYLMTPAIWDGGEPADGPTVRWLKQHAARLGVYLGTSFLEAEGEDFHNTFVLATPQGEIAGRVRKQTPAAFETFFTKGDAGPHTIDTPLGRIGVGICYENQLTFLPRLMAAQSVDLMLMPHSAPLATQGVIFPKKAIQADRAALKSLTPFYARMLGIPVMLVNKHGPWETPLPLLGPLAYQRSRFPGLSAITDSDGTLKAQLDDQEGVIVEDVTLDPARKTNSATRRRGRWNRNETWSKKIFVLAEATGRIWYRFKRERKQKARAISAGQA